MGEIKLDGYICERCEHTWVSRSTSEGKPTVCPKCKSPYWDTPRKLKVKRPARKVHTVINDKGGELFPSSSKDDSALFPG